MDNKTFHDHRAKLAFKCCEILRDRGPAYSGDGDRFANFKLIAQLLDNFHVNTATPQGVWAVYYLKHVFAILSCIGQPTAQKLATLTGSNIPDSRNYLDLFYGMVKEKESG